MRLLETHQVPELEEMQRLSDYAVGIFRSITTRKGLKKSIERGRIKVNGKLGKTGDHITGGETIELYARKQKRSPKINVDFDVLYQDEHLAVVDKPSGIVVSGNQKWTLENALSRRLKRSSEMDVLPRAEAVHRLDYPTSGALLVGKTAKAVRLLNKMFEEKKIEKTYLAITIGKSKEKATIENTIKGKSAKTSFVVISTIPSDKYGALNLIELNPETGRRHQLRIHLAEQGTPILGEKKYGDPSKQGKGSGLYLHASSLKFIHPITEKEMDIIAPTPKKFGKLFKSDEEE